MRDWENLFYLENIEIFEQQKLLVVNVSVSFKNSQRKCRFTVQTPGFFQHKFGCETNNRRCDRLLSNIRIIGVHATALIVNALISTRFERFCV